VDVVDGTGCGTPGFVRISYAVPEADLTEALRRVSEVLDG
jgi:aspartate aminotransferase